ncbi:MAG: NitT/TauT family transport system permease protein [Myxococcota bacterium]|jgi:NitT/TauT family transport system permease protein
MISPVILPSPAEIMGQMSSLWFERELSRSAIQSIIRVAGGFSLAMVIAVPLGVAMAAFSPIRALFNPVAAVGGYLPISALVPLTLSWFGIGELQKVVFLALAGFVVLLPLVIQAVDDVDDVYLKTAYTLGASRTQAVMRVLIPVSLAGIFDALRLVVGVGWTYILLAEMVSAERGLGNLIIVAQRRGPREHIYLVLIVIIVIAFVTDRTLAALGKALFPYREAR